MVTSCQLVGFRKKNRETGDEGEFLIYLLRPHRWGI